MGPERGLQMRETTENRNMDNARRVLRGIRKDYGKWLPLMFCMLLAAVLIFYGSGNYYLWSDEAETALYGKRILLFGLPLGFDGRNLYEFRNGYSLNTAFLPTLSPWLQFYVAALSQYFFGHDALGARMLFMVLGLLSIWLQFVWVRGYFQDRLLAHYAALFMATSVCLLLFVRQCRYYALVIILGLIVICCRTVFRGRWYQYAEIAVVFVLLFFAHSLVTVCYLVALLMGLLIFENSRIMTLRFFIYPGLAAAVVIGTFLIWLYAYGGPNDPNFLVNIQPPRFLKIFWMYLSDFNTVQLVQLGAIFLLLYMWAVDWKRYRGISGCLRKEMMIISIVLIFTFILSILSPQNHMETNADIRYAAIVFPLLILTQAMAVTRLHRWNRFAAGAAAGLLIFTNLLTFMPYRSYIYEYVRENVRPFQNSTKIAVKFLDQRSRQDEMLLVSPNNMLSSLEYYLGDKLLFCNVIGEDNRNLLGAGVTLPRYTYASDTIPDWIVFFGLEIDLRHTYQHLKKLAVAENYRSHVISYYGPDLSRPEIFWRAFRPVTDFRPDMALYIMERKR